MSRRIPCSAQKIRFVSLLSRSLRWTKEDTTVFVVNQKLRGTDVADAARSAEQARKEKYEEEMNRTAELRSSQVCASKVSDDTQKNILELEDAIAVLRAENNKETVLRKRSTKGTEEQNQEGSGRRITSLYNKKSKRWDWRGDARTYNKTFTEVRKVIAHVVRYGLAGQTWHEQCSRIFYQKSKTFRAMRTAVKRGSPGDEKSLSCRVLLRQTHA